ncbi:alpha-amylase family glycosyl hydrolase [Frigidibacter sp. ROC022]|uniref:alpha-amylase family glycosyl hydrolase n=1 Tax=Frigidibacter sp. ROC022 TaxID=2971796 RepID=UPI00215A9B13|nr:alpha-amylase family glycosyl hydrolase [Frigidibacter sp. ROC022]MCR8725689.1 alpha-amylase family glycosyl hydrolase [Frigidibacter sp. ROC022]
MALSRADREIFELRLERSRADLFDMLDELYGQRSDYEAISKALLALLKRSWAARPADLKRLDLQRDLAPDWFQRPRMAGYVFYVDRFADTLAGVQERLDWLDSLGITYVHLMPCLKPRPGDSDGGYAVMDYGAIDPRLGDMADFGSLAAALRARGISLCIDLVLNHTAQEHDWARRAAAGEAKYRDYYLIFEDDSLPRQYEETLVEVFPDTAPGNFTRQADGSWVWTTFNRFQWDLNWANPQVFLEMAGVMLDLANRGVDVLRLDAVAFLWKRMGSRCQSEPEVHKLLQALRAVSRIAAPALIHLEEAIVSPAEMLSYLGRGRHDGKEGNLAYHNSLMVQFWSALAARDCRLMTHVLRSHFPTTVTNATYATYIRCHDDIGWAVTDEDAGAVGLNGHLHRAFLSEFYTGEFPGSFARGALFQENPATGDRRISGSFASLAGLERAGDDPLATEMAVARILLGHALIASYGGIPLIYMGDEIAMLNDWGYLDDPEHAPDSRWLHRPRMDWEAAQSAQSGETAAARVLTGTRRILARRAAIPAFHGAVPVEILAPGPEAVLAYRRRAPVDPVLCLLNFSEQPQPVSAEWCRGEGVRRFDDLLAERPVPTDDGAVRLPPYGALWLV